MDISEKSFLSKRHKTFYLSCGPEDGPLVIMTHGWPELSRSWRHQLKHLGELGYLAVAPDMRGYGRSSIYPDKNAYSQKEIIQDMRELLDDFGRKKAVWVGHDWGSVVAWNMALHYPDRVSAVASLCVPYSLGGPPDAFLHTINRKIYPEDQFPAGQWDYQYFYYENFESAQKEMDADPHKFVRALFRRGDPDGIGKPAITASVRKNNGWFSRLGAMPDLPVDENVLTEEDAKFYGCFLEKNSFFGPNSWYVNGSTNNEYANEVQDFQLTMPCLFIHATYDFVCDTTTSNLATFMRENCINLAEARVDSGHWMAQEKPSQVNSILEEWLRSL